MMLDLQETTEAPPHVALLQMMTGYWVSQSVYVAAKLGIADLLGDGPKHHEVLATATHTHSPSLYRLLRALASVGVFSETTPGSFGLTPNAALLQSDAPHSMRALAVMYGEEQYQAWGDMLKSVATGDTAFDRVFGTSYFPYLAGHPESNETFNQAMTGWSALLDAAVLAAYDFSQFQTMVDVGGGYGRLLAAILRTYPRMRGVLFDQPHVVAGAGALLRESGVTERCETVGGDFFVELPRGADAYVLAQIVHDWDDQRSLTILKTCRRAIGPTGKLLLVEMVIAPGNESDFGKFLDLHMLANVGGRERTEAEYRTLLAEAGFRLTVVVPTQAGSSVVEAIPA
jgi:O-methyltransferase domain/Dimerisation domain